MSRSKPPRQTAAEARADAEARAAAGRAAREAAIDAHFGATSPGGSLIALDLAVTGVFVVLAVLAAVVGGSLVDLSGNVSLVIAGVGLLVFCLALWEGAQRSRTATMGIGGWFFLAGSARRDTQMRLLGALGVQVVVGIATASADFDAKAAVPTPLAFGTLVPLFGLAVCGLWGARYGWFPPRAEGGGG